MAGQNYWGSGGGKQVEVKKQQSLAKRQTRVIQAHPAIYWSTVAEKKHPVSSKGDVPVIHRDGE
ncbi:hypothetical protein RND71_038050 [Anisodus tanguticus]|uniref:Uncharacterized protein n=1 Tax=Anisodus tanguticus TaxID=243964 RepID=A0AAE1UYT9_9SOLA|nr:hypothetical protein RND71_038050 [Anisodus tanguticus]